MKLWISARTHPGLVRRKNEDNLCLCNLVLPENKIEESLLLKTGKPALLAVFDGMGGFLHGEKASFFAADTARNIYKVGKNLCDKDLMQICTAANGEICEFMKQEAVEYMGTTAAMLYFSGKKLLLCNVGDSPIYRYRSGMLRRIHKEHSERSLREALLGEVIPQSKKFKLTQYIGMPPDEVRIEPYLAEGQLQAGEYYLICSDGISDMVDDEQIQDVMNEEKNPFLITKKLVAMAMEAGGKDNATVICVQVCGGSKSVEKKEKTESAEEAK